jgi:tetratricopeptide (TPR) repeat protein
LIADVLVTTGGSVRLLDFGISKLLDDIGPAQPGLTLEQGRALTPVYASPEQIGGRPATVQSDVYSLGVLLYELLTGSLPFKPQRETPGALEAAILAGERVPASRRVTDRDTARALRGDLDAILGRALHAEPERRYASADALAHDIERFLAGDAVAARPDSLAYRLRIALRRHRLAAIAGSLILLSLLVGGGLAVRQSQRAAAAAEREQLVKSFVGDMLRASLSTPHDGSGARGVVQGSVDNGMRLIQTRFVGQPALQAELQGTVGAIYSSMGAYAYAAEYRQRRLGALRDSGAGGPAMAEAEAQLAEDLLRAGKSAQAATHAAQAVAFAQGQPAALNDALALMARVHLADGKPAEAAKTLDRLEAGLAGVREETLALAWLRAGRALWQISQAVGDEGDRQLAQAIEIATRREGPTSLAAIDMRLALARERGRRNFGDTEAQRQFAAALQALEDRGGPDAVRAAYERAQLWWLLPGNNPHMPYAQAVAELRKSQSAIDNAALPVPALMRAEMDFFRGQIEVQYGNLVEAERWLGAGRDLVLQANEAPAPRFRALGYLATLANETGRPDEADALWLERQKLRAAMGQQRHLYSAYDFVGRAANLTMAGRFDEAGRVLAEAPHFEAAASGAAMPKAVAALHFAAARLQFERGRFAAARAAIADVPVTVDAGDGVGSGAVLRAQLQCADAQTARAGWASLEKEIQAEAPVRYAHAPYLAWLRAQSGLCALSFGDRATAMHRGAEARAAFVVQPGVHPYHKAPLERLEAALRQTRPQG